MYIPVFNVTIVEKAREARATLTFEDTSWLHEGKHHTHALTLSASGDEFEKVKEKLMSLEFFVRGKQEFEAAFMAWGIVVSIFKASGIECGSVDFTTNSYRR